MIKRNLNCKKGFSLIEALVAVAILIVGILSAFILLIRTTATIPAMQARLTAASLAQEGIEEVRALRDSDFIAGKGFKTFLNNKDCSQINGGCNISADDSGIIQLIPITQEGEIPLKFDDSRDLYSYYSGSPSIFSRQIAIDSDAGHKDLLRVIATVKYSIKGTMQTVTATDQLYNWLNPTP
ncbi:MAG TPA: prepilin-type N-terminal cleavage/methylation domain-containing protein [Candidatus Paceibacterota bacterium]|nr:prepilin-type N-terminal cleavage/methylation domain-containing protein [Candidatus Paceibacterota bacterium]